MEKVLNLTDIVAAGRQVSLDDIGRTDDALAYALDAAAPLELSAPVFLNRPEFAAVFPAGAVRRHESMICAVRDCFLLGPFGYVVLPTGQLLRQSVVNLDGDSIQYTLEQFKAQYPGRTIPWAAAPGPVFAANSYATNNYFHLLMDALAQLHWRERNPAAAAAKVIVSGYPNAAEATLPFMADAMRCAGVMPAEVQPFDGTLLFCSRVIFPRRNTGANPAKVQWLRQRFGVAGRVRGKARLYVARGPAPRRRIVNEPEILKLLEKHGFAVINPGALSVADQVKAFSEAAVVVGAHGAALTNATFMGPGGVLVELTHDKRVVWTYHEIAGAAGLHYACVVGQTSGDASQPIFADFSVDLDALDAAMNAVLATVKSVTG